MESEKASWRGHLSMGQEKGEEGASSGRNGRSPGMEARESMACSGLCRFGLVDREVPGGSWDCGGAKLRGSGLCGVGSREPQKVK